jgi:hypothetical protein
MQMRIICIYRVFYPNWLRMSSLLSDANPALIVATPQFCQSRPFNPGQVAADLVVEKRCAPAARGPAGGWLPVAAFQRQDGGAPIRDAGGLGWGTTVGGQWSHHCFRALHFDAQSCVEQMLTCPGGGTRRARGGPYTPGSRSKGGEEIPILSMAHDDPLTDGPTHL